MRTIGLIIEGVNAPGEGSYYDGIVWYFGEHPTDQLTTYLWLRDLTQIPQTISETCQPVSGKFQSSPSNYQITRTPESELYILKRQLRTTVAIAADYAAGDASIVLNTNGLTGLIWVDNECIQLSTESPAGTYFCYPGIADTDEAPHLTGTLVWQAPVRLHRRRTRLIEYDWDTGELRTIARGWLESVSESMTGILDIATLSLPSLISGAKLNKNARKWSGIGRVFPSGRIGGSTNMQSRTVRSPQTSGFNSSIQVAGTIANVTRTAGVWFITGCGPFNLPQFSAPPPEDVEDGAFSDDAVRELFVVSTNSARSSSRFLNDQLPNTWRNRIALTYGFLRSGGGSVNTGFDRWDRSWGLGLRAIDFDETAITALIKRVSPDVDQLVLGWDGEEVGLEELLTQTLLNPGGYHFATREDGRIYFAALRMPTVDDLTNAAVVLAIEPRLAVDWQIAEQVSGVTADIGGTPWSDPDILSINIDTGQPQDTTRAAAYETDAQYPLDYSTYATTRQDLIPEAMDRLAFARRGPPVISLRTLPLVGDTLDLGRWYRISVPIEDWWVIEGVSRDATDVESLGYLVGRKYNIAAGTYDLEFLSHAQDGRIARLRAPTGIIRTGATSATYAVELLHGLTAGEIVDLCNSDGTVASDNLEVLSVTSNTVTLDTSTTHTVGQILRLAEFVDYTPTPRKWAYIAGLDELIQDLEPADIYG